MAPETVAAALLVPSVLVAAYTLYGTIRGLRAIEPLPPRARERSAWPTISLVVPACNEESSLEEATRAKLSTDYPNLEVILVDDRSTDGTGALVDRLAAADPRVRAVHIDTLPEGWLGKVHALHRGTTIATGEWLLYSDADVHMQPDLLRRVIGEAEARGLDFVSLLPKLESSGFGLDALFSTFMRAGVSASRAWELDDPNAQVAAGGGFFNLARRSVWEKTPGFPWIKLEILDDGAFAQMMKRAGARAALFRGMDGVSLHYYRSLGEAMHGFEKNGYALVGAHRPLVALASCTVVALVELGPAIACALPFPLARAMAVFALVAFAACQIAIARAMKRSLASAAIPVLGPLLLLVFFARSAVLAHVRGGIVWRGTLYRLEDLRSGRRVVLF